MRCHISRCCRVSAKKSCNIAVLLQVGRNKRRGIKEIAQKHVNNKKKRAKSPLVVVL